MSNDLTVRFTGNHIQPGRVRSRELGDVIAAFEEAVAAVAVRAHPELKPEQIIVGLATIHAGSIGLAFEAPLGEPVYRAAHQLVSAVQAHDWAGLPWDALKPLRALLKFVTKHQCSADFTVRHDDLVAVAAITADTEIPRAATLHGTTTLYAEVKRAGGMEPRVMLQTLSGRTLFCDTDEAIAKALGARLYEQVGVVGYAEWDYQSLEVIGFEITEVLSYRRTSPVTAFQSLRQEFGHYFDAIEDPEAWVHELRGEPDA
jgi:hypothetical protein